MDEPLTWRTLLLSALYEGTGQLAAGRTTKGLLLLGMGTVFGILGGVLGTMLRFLGLRRGPLRTLPDRLNSWALVWLGIYLYNLYDAYTLAAGADDEADLFDYEEYEPQEASAGPGNGAATAVPTATPFTGAPGRAAPRPAAATTRVEPVSPIFAENPEAALAQARAAEARASAAHPAQVATLGDLGLDWAQGVTKTQLMNALGDDEQVRGVFGQYLPSDRAFHSADEALTLIPTQAWQDAQGRDWTGGDLPPGEEPSGYLDSAAGQLPPGDTVH